MNACVVVGADMLGTRAVNVVVAGIMAEDVVGPAANNNCIVVLAREEVVGVQSVV
jgi:hypothetical protein